MDTSPIILLVDDDPSIRKLCSRMLVRMGFQLLEAENGSKARQLVKDHGEQAHAILLDMNLPDVPGSELADEFCLECPSLPIIFFTGTVSSDNTIQHNGQLRHFLRKPFTKMSLLEALGKCNVPLPST